MVRYRDTIELSEGVRVDLLVTPHLYSYRGRSGMSLQLTDDATPEQTAEFFADLIWASALNAWEIDGGGIVEDCPARRGDVHALMMTNPAEFRRAVEFLTSALTGGRKEETPNEVKKKSKRHSSGIR